jgi:hypothetical protein
LLSTMVMKNYSFPILLGYLILNFWLFKNYTFRGTWYGIINSSRIIPPIFINIDYEKLFLSDTTRML